MGKESGDRNFKLIALAVMAATGIATLLHAAHVVWRDLREERTQGRRNDRRPPFPDKAPPVEYASGEAEPQDHDQRSWVRRARLTEPTPASEHLRPEYRDQHGHGRR